MGREPESSVANALAEVRKQAWKSPNPVFVHLVTNGVVGDSRVVKAAEVSRSLGFQTLILGITRDDEPQALSVEGVDALLVPFFPKQRIREFIQDWRRWTLPIWTVRLGKSAKGALRGRPGPSRQLRETSPPEWSKDRNHNLRINVVFAEALDALRPAIIHVHDTQPLPAAVAYASAGRLRGQKVRVIYDAHECVPVQAKVFPDLPFHRTRAIIERDYIHDVDQVLTVSPQIARLLQKTYVLPTRPRVVTNAPAAQRAVDAPQLRERLGLASQVPLAVYSGWVADIRGVDDAITALAEVPELHLAIVTDTTKKHTATLTRLARRLGVLDRVHFTNYVLPSQVSAYLASADIGLIPLKRGPHFDLSLPTKYREYLHAGLPLVVSSNRAMAAETLETGVGEVFRCGEVADLVGAIEKVLANPQRYRDAITPEILRKNSWETQAEVLAKRYRSLSPTPPNNDIPSPVGAALRSLFPGSFVEDALDARTSAAPTIPGISLLIGPANYAGQAYAWSESAKREYNIDAGSIGGAETVYHAPHRLAFTDHRDLQQASEELQWVINNHTHVMIDAFRRLFGDLLGDDVENEIAVLRHHGIQVGLISHGSDIRDPDLHQRWVPDSYFVGAPDEGLKNMKQLTSANKRIADRFDGPLFVSTPDLLNDLPQATWLPVAIDFDLWAAIPDPPPRRAPRVLHRPSRAMPIKGSDVVVPVLERLHDRGIIDYVPDVGTVPAAEMPAFVSESDIVVDQISSSHYGVAASEAMAAGRVVVGYLHPEFRDCIDNQIPIVDATPASFEETMIALAKDHERRAELGRLGRQYAKKWHSGRASAEALGNFLRS